MLMFDARKRVSEWIYLDARNRRVSMLGNGLIINMRHEHQIYKKGIKGCREFSEVTQAGGERRKKSG